MITDPGCTLNLAASLISVSPQLWALSTIGCPSCRVASATALLQEEVWAGFFFGERCLRDVFVLERDLFLSTKVEFIRSNSELWRWLVGMLCSVSCPRVRLNKWTSYLPHRPSTAKKLCWEAATLSSESGYKRIERCHWHCSEALLILADPAAV